MDPLSGIASVLSVADVAVRSCERLRDLISELRDAPQSVQRLRRTIQNTESVLRNVWLNVAEFNSSTLATEYHEVLPEAVERCLEEIRADLNLLEKLLAPGELGRDIGARIRHVLSKKPITDILGRLEEQQNLLTLTLQSVAQRQQTKLHSAFLNLRKDLTEGQKGFIVDLLSAAKPNESLLEVTSNMQRDARGIQTALNTAIGSISSNVLGSQLETSAQLKQLYSMLSDRLDQGRTQIDGSINAVTKSALIPIVRAELRRIVLPAVNHNKSHVDLQMDRIRHAIDGIAQSLGHSLNDETTSRDHAWRHTPAPSVSKSCRHDGTCPDTSLDKNKTQVSDYSRRSKDCPGDQPKLWNQTWTYTRKWSFGLLCVRIYASRVRREEGAMSQAFGRSTSAWSEEVYNLSITFQPADRMLSRGIRLALGTRYDPSGYYLRCPEVSAFAIIPLHSEVFALARKGDIQGLKRLFVENLASPTDRDKNGITVLHAAAIDGEFDVCEFLINEGADPCVTEENGQDCLAYMHFAIVCFYSERWKFGEAASQTITRKCAITRLFLRNGCDIHETYQLPFLKHPFRTLIYHGAEGAVDSPGESEESIWRDRLHYINIWLPFLSDQNIDVDFAEAAGIHMDGTTLLQSLILDQIVNSKRFRRKTTEAIFMLCSLGANVSARMPDSGAQPLHLVAGAPYPLEGSFYATSQFVILLDFGADPCARDGLGRTVTQIACSSGWEKQWIQALCKCRKTRLIAEQWEEAMAGGKDAPLDDAIRTGVDVTELSKPSFEGLSRRIAARGDRLDD